MAFSSKCSEATSESSVQCSNALFQSVSIYTLINKIKALDSTMSTFVLQSENRTELPLFSLREENPKFWKVTDYTFYNVPLTK